MSIRKEIASASANGTLLALPPLLRGAPMLRELFVVPSLYEVAQLRDYDDEFSVLHANLRATLDQFSEGRRITVSQKPHRKRADTFLARVDPIADECWDIRSLAPKPGMRVFGRFAEKDLFIALHWDYRENLEADPSAWKQAVLRTKTQWQSLFTLPPLKGKQVSDYLSNEFEISDL